MWERDQLSMAVPAEQPVDNPALCLILRLGVALHRYGVPAHRLEQALEVMSGNLGLDGRFYSTPTAILASFGPPEALRTSMIRVEPGELDLARLAELDILTTDMVRGRCSIPEASKRLDAILSAAPLYGPTLTVLAFAIASGGAAYLLGGGLREVMVGLVISGITGLLAVNTNRMPFVARMLEGIGAFLAAALAVLFERVLGPFSVQLAIIAGLIVLLPGLTLTVAMTELATRNLVSGTSRLMSAVLVFLEIGFGVALGSKLDSVLPPVPALPEAAPLPGWVMWPALILGSGAFAVLFRSRRKDALWIILASSLAYFGARLGSEFLGPQLGAFVGSFALCVGSNVLARFLDKPSVITILPGLLLLVPGSVGYRSLDALLETNVLSGVETAFHMVLVAIAIVAGLLLANATMPPRKVL